LKVLIITSMFAKLNNASIENPLCALQTGLKSFPFM